MLKALSLTMTVLALFNSCSAPGGDLPRFHEVDPGKVYRSAQPSEAGYLQLKAMGVRTVVKLNTERTQEEESWAKAAGIHLIEIPTPGLWAPSKEDEEKIQDALGNTLRWPVLVHCTQGQDRTGLAIAIYRIRSQGWAYAAARKEWLDLGHSNFLFAMNHFFEEYE